MTLGATINLALCTKREQDNDGSSSLEGGNHTADMTPPGSNDDRDDNDHDHDGHNDVEGDGEALA